jgi:L-ascorbate metabolism protein UlaG (beta-lactamase superfamily)
MPPRNEVSVTYIGGPTLLLEVAGLRLLTDPTFDHAPHSYPAGAFTHHKVTGPALEPSALGPIDAVLLSHDHHFDNLDIRGREFLNEARQVITTQEAAARLGGNAIGLEPSGSFILNGPDGEALRITATPARHGPAGNDRGPVIGFLLAGPGAEDEPIYISGDTVWYEGVADTLRCFPTIGVAVLFVGAAQVPVLPANLTFSAQEAVLVGKALPSATVIPVHFEGWKHLTESKADLIAAFTSAGQGHQLLWPPAGQSIRLDQQR